MLGADISQLYAALVPYRHGVCISRLKAGLCRIKQGVKQDFARLLLLPLPKFWKAMPPVQGRELLYAIYYQFLIELG